YGKQHTRQAKKSLSKLKDGFIQEVPDELSGCEICRIPECPNKKWDSCGYRIEQMISLEKNNKEAKTK
ncbi:MAG: hypothetical protein KAG66_09555, partial [Methylococcales bacterium]|nr:hypothetical protein [Methylococcales bacterium]